MAIRVSMIGSSSSATTKPGWNDYEHKQFERTFLSEGIIQGVGNAFQVTQKAAGANLSVDVKSGRALIEITNTNLAHGETYLVYFDNSATVNKAVTTADPTNPRKDRVVLRVDVATDPDGAAANIGIIEVLAGTPAGSPSAPATPSNALSLYIIDVPAGDTTITDDQITDDRSYCELDTDKLVSLARLADLASNATGKGASLIAIEDSANNFPTATTVEEALAEAIELSGLDTFSILAQDMSPSSMFPCSTLQTIAPTNTSIAPDTNTKGNSGSASTHTISHTCTGSNLALYVGFTTRVATDTVTSVTYNGVAMTRVDKQLDIGNSPDLSAFLYVLAAPASGAHNVVITLSGASVIDYSFTSYTGCAAVQPTSGVAAGEASPSTDFDPTCTTMNDACWLHMYASNDTGNYSAGTNTTLRGAANNHQSCDSNGAITSKLSMTSAAANHGGIIVPINPLEVYPQMRTLDFDKTSYESAEGVHFLPSNYAGGTVTVKIHWRTTGASGDAVWKVQAVAIADNEASARAYSAAQSVTDTSTGANKKNTTAATGAITIGGTPAAGSPVWFKVSRDATNVADTLDADAQLIGIDVTYV